MTPKAFSLQIRNVAAGADLNQVRVLQHAYTAFLSEITVPGEIDLNRRLAEIAELPNKNSPPQGALLLALVDDEPAGCVALGPITLASGETVAELRRMWVPPAFRGYGIGRALILEASVRARTAGHTAIYLDCLSALMPAAMNLYRAIGFEPTQRYKQDHSVQETAFFRLDLSRGGLPAIPPR